MEDPRTTPDVDLVIGSQLRARREAIGLSPHELAACCQCTAEDIIRYEAGSRALSPAQLQTLAILLEVPVGFFTG